MENGTYISDEVNELFGIQTELEFSFPSLSLSRWKELGEEKYLKNWLEVMGYKIHKISHVEKTITANRVIFNQKFDLEDFIDDLETESKWEDPQNRNEAMRGEVSNKHQGYKLILQNNEWKLQRQSPFFLPGYSFTSGVSGMSGTSGGAGFSGKAIVTSVSAVNGLSGSSSI